jgi:YHS domain-containing protein
MQTTFDDRKVAEHVNAGFIPLLVDADEYPEFVASIGVEGLPATVIMTPEMKVVERITGYRTPRQLGAQLVKFCPVETEIATADARTQPRSGSPGGANQGVIDLQQAGRQPTAAQQVVAQPPAFNGCCLVSLLEDKQLNRGLEAHTSVYRGVTLAFASDEYKRRFEAEPERYWPAFDGYCAVSARDFQASREGMPNLTALYRGRIWLFARPDLRRRFISAPQVYAGWASR